MSARKRKKTDLPAVKLDGIVSSIKIPEHSNKTTEFIRASKEAPMIEHIDEVCSVIQTQISTRAEKYEAAASKSKKLKDDLFEQLIPLEMQRRGLSGLVKSTASALMKTFISTKNKPPTYPSDFVFSSGFFMKAESGSSSAASSSSSSSSSSSAAAPTPTPPAAASEKKASFLGEISNMIKMSETRELSSLVVDSKEEPVVGTCEFCKEKNTNLHRVVVVFVNDRRSTDRRLTAMFLPGGFSRRQMSLLVESFVHVADMCLECMAVCMEAVKQEAEIKASFSDSGRCYLDCEIDAGRGTTSRSVVCSFLKKLGCDLSYLSPLRL
jgi:hypothetical protein